MKRGDKALGLLGLSGSDVYKKVIVSGGILEVYIYEKLPGHGSKNRQGNDKEKELDWEGDYTDLSFTDAVEVVDRERRRRLSSCMRTRNNIRRLVLSNFNNGSKFVTLTFADNVTDIEVANKEFKKFIQRLRRRYKKFKYLAVIEFQKRGAVHFHMICNLPYVKKAELSVLWGQGFVKINKIDHVDNVGAYIIKYMVKDLLDKRLFGKKAYNCSKGLDKPVVLRGDDADRIIQFYGLEGKQAVYTSSYSNEYVGEVQYKEYNLNRG